MMMLYHLQFLGDENLYVDLDSARYAILPVPYEGAVSYGTGTAGAPDAVLKASHFLETYDDILCFEPIQGGIITLEPALVSENHTDMHNIIYNRTSEIVRANKMPIILGGDHSISSAVFRALQEKYEPLSCVQIDAHADLRDSYEGSIFSHACVLARIREQTPHTLQIGMRSLAKEEANKIDKENIPLWTMQKFRARPNEWKNTLHVLPDPVFITFDVDVFDWSVISSTGTPEPGGFTWDEALDVLQFIFRTKSVVGFDIVELAVSPYDRNSPFAVAKLIYKMIGMHINSSSILFS